MNAPTSFPGIPSVFSLLNPSGNDWTLVEDVINGTKQFDLSSYFGQMSAIGGAWYLPAGTFLVNNTWAVAPGLSLRGADRGNTKLILGGPAGGWGAQLCNADGTGEVESPKFYDMTIQASQNGIRLNRTDGGFTDDASSQAYMMRPTFERVNFLCNSGNPNVALQLSKCFNSVIRDCLFDSFGVSVNAVGSDMVDVLGNRFQYEKDCSIVAEDRYPFGSSIRIKGNDFNNPSKGFLRSGYIDTLVDSDNHFELDTNIFDAAALQFFGDNAMHIRVRDNRVQLGSGLCKDWISITPHPNRYLVDVHNNTTSGPMGDVNYPWAYYFNNAGSRALLSWGNNSITSSSAVWPMNTDEALAPIPPGCAAYVTAGRPGVTFSAGMGGKLVCSGGDFTLPFNPDPSQFMEISEWGSQGAQLPGNNLTGKLTITIVTAAGQAGLQGHFDVFDGDVWMDGGAITHTKANQYQKTAVTHNFSKKAVVRLWNADAAHQERFYVHSVAFAL